ncbi:MAG: hypothetical protein F6K21_06505 [Symploca sp. SIO2D2]|nr:hypothetical protein [Symploca sp. SIO2D2]
MRIKFGAFIGAGLAIIWPISTEYAHQNLPNTIPQLTQSIPKASNKRSPTAPAKLIAFITYPKFYILQVIARAGFVLKLSQIP